MMMKRSNSTSMISDLLAEKERYPRRRNSIGPGLKGKRLLSSSNASLPCSGENILTPFWSSPIKHHGHHLPQQPLSSPLPFSRINSPTSRVVQLRKEESVDERLREMEQDREVTSQLQLNQSWSELKLDDDDIRPEMMETLPCPVAMTTGIQFSSPSSPVNISSRVRSRSLTPTSPSSSRTFNHMYRRSLSPAPLRPSSLVLQPQRKRQRNSDLNEDMDISPTQLHPPAKRAVFQSPLITVPPTSCTSPLLTTQAPNPVGIITSQQPSPPLHDDDEVDLMPSCPAFDTSRYSNYPELSFDHTPLTLNDTKTYPNTYTPNHTHQRVESAFLPFKTNTNGLTPPTVSNVGESYGNTVPCSTTSPLSNNNCSALTSLS